jgi:hypothetical protein
VEETCLAKAPGFSVFTKVILVYAALLSQLDHNYCWLLFLDAGASLNRPALSLCKKEERNTFINRFLFLITMQANCSRIVTKEKSNIFSANGTVLN